MTTFDLAGYLARLGQRHVPEGAGGLAVLQSAQIRAVPFENVDALLGREPPIDAGAAAAKAVNGGRGGWCFELNALLGAALTALGYTVARRLARVRMGAASGGPRTHMALVVTLGPDRWLVDAGFGGPAPLAPLRLDSDDRQEVENGTYRLATDPATGERVVTLSAEGGDFALYGLDEAHVTDPDVVAASYLCANWSGSPFPSHLMVNGYDGTTRIGIFDRGATFESDGRREKADIADAAALAEILRGRLGLNLENGTLDAVWRRIAPEVHSR